MKLILGVGTLTIAMALGSACSEPTEKAAATPTPSIAAKVETSENTKMDPIVGVWYTPKVGNGDMWLGFASDGSSAFILNPEKAPGTIIPNPVTVVEIYETTGKWAKNGDVYSDTLYRNGKSTGSNYYKVDASQLIECDIGGQPKAGGFQWSRKMPMNNESDSFVKEYIKTMKKALESSK